MAADRTTAARFAGNDYIFIFQIIRSLCVGEDHIQAIFV